MDRRYGARLSRIPRLPRPVCLVFLGVFWHQSVPVLYDYLDLLAEAKPAKLEHAAIRWQGRLELEASVLTLAESQLALLAPASPVRGRA